MKIKLISALLLLSAMTLNGQYFFEGFTDSQKLDTAHAYLMVSEKFNELGDSEQAEKYENMAFFIYPELIRTDRADLEAMVSLPERVEEKPMEGSDKSNVIRYYFSKLLRSITTGDLETVDSLIADRLYLPEYTGGLSKAQLRPMVQEIDRKYDLSRFSPGALYKLDTIEVMKVEEGTYIVTVEGEDSQYLYTSGITFFGRIQKFQFRHFDTGWKIDRISAIF